MREDYTLGTFIIIPSIDLDHISACAILTILFGVYKIFIGKKHKVISANNGFIWRVGLRTRQRFYDNWYTLHAIGQLSTFMRHNMKLLCFAFFTKPEKSNIFLESFPLNLFFNIQIWQICGGDVYITSKIIYF